MNLKISLDKEIKNPEQFADMIYHLHQEIAEKLDNEPVPGLTPAQYAAILSLMAFTVMVGKVSNKEEGKIIVDKFYELYWISKETADKIPDNSFLVKGSNKFN